MSQIKVDVPATLTNQFLGLGSSAIALGLYDSVEVEESHSGLNIDITGFGEDFLSKTISNKIVEVLRAIGSRTGKGVSGLNIRIENNIPRRVGLGSSASAAVAAALAANSIFELGLSRSEVFGKATEFESNAAAVAACLLGGMSIVAPYSGQPIIKSLNIPQIKICLVTPILEPPETTSLNVFESAPPFDARQIGLNALFTEAIRSGDFDLMRRLMTSINLAEVSPLLQSWFPRAASMALNEGAAFVMPCNYGPGVSAFAEKNHEAICSALLESIRSLYDGECQSWIVPVNLHGISLSEVKAVSKSDTYSGKSVMSDRDN